MSVARIEEAFSLLDRGEAAPAADVLQQVLVEAPGYAPAYVLFARACETLHRWPEALMHWQEAALLMPTLDVAREGVLRATRVIAALQALDARTSAPQAASPVARDPIVSPLPTEPETRAPYTSKSLTPPAEPEPRSAASPTRAPLAEQPVIRLGGMPSATEEVPPPSVKTFGSPPPPPVDPPATHLATAPAPPAEEQPRAPLEGAAFNAPPPPPDVFAREEHVPPLAEEPAVDKGDTLDLDALIEQLNTQGRIRARTDVDKIPAPDLEDDIEDMVSETLARIYATQGQYDEAARIYELLAAQQPAQADAFMQQAADMRARADQE